MVNVSSPDASILAIDIGTSSIRAIAYNTVGEPVGFDVRLPYSMDTTHDGGVEIDADRLLDTLCRVLDRVILQHGSEMNSISAVGMSTFWHNLVGVGGDGLPVTPLISWADTRPASVIGALRERLDEEATHARTGCILHPSYLPAKVLWFAQEQASVFESVKRWMSIGEYIMFRLFGTAKCSVSMASGTGLLNAHTCQWDADTLDQLPIDEEHLSEITDLESPSIGLKSEYANRWPQLDDVPWWPALGDGACSNIGSGCVSADRTALMVGTSGAMRVMLSEEVFDIPEGLWCYRADDRRILLGGALSNGGNVYSWMRETLQLESQEAIEHALVHTEPVTHGLTVLPFWAGERSPGWHASARATITGLTLHSTPMDILRSGLEATAYCFASIYERLETINTEGHEIIASGAGLLQSPAWMQMMADVLGKPVVASAIPEASSRGVALLVLESLGVLNDLSDAPVPLSETFQPDSRRHRLYHEAMAQQQALYDELIS
jgi:gluconokinase